MCVPGTGPEWVVSVVKGHMPRRCLACQHDRCAAAVKVKIQPLRLVCCVFVAFVLVLCASVS